MAQWDAAIRQPAATRIRPNRDVGGDTAAYDEGHRDRAYEANHHAESDRDTRWWARCAASDADSNSTTDPHADPPSNADTDAHTIAHADAHTNPTTARVTIEMGAMR